MARTGTFGGFHFDPEIFGSYQQEVDTTKTELVLSGAVVHSAELERIIAGGTNVATIPLYAPLTGDALNYDGEVDNVPVTVSGKKQTGMVFGRMKAWKSNEFVKELSTADPMADVARKVGKFYQKVNQKTLLSILKGISGVAGIAGHKTDISSASTTVAAGNKISAAVVEGAKQKALGDNASVAAIMIAHSAVTSTLKLEGLVEYAKYTVGGALMNDINLPTYQGMILLEDDGMPTDAATETVAKKYHTYILGAGFILEAPAPVETPTYPAYDPETDGGIEKLYTKERMIYHPNGFSLAVNNIAKESPTDAELATTANWSLVMDEKNIPFVEIISNG